LYFVDELVEAPARQADIVGLTGTDCETLLSRPHEQASDSGTVLFSRTLPWPVRPDADLWGEIPKHEEILLMVAVYDTDHQQIARACQNVDLESGAQEVEMHALPLCTMPATQLDITFVIDTSTQMEVVDPELLHLSELVPRVID